MASTTLVGIIGSGLIGHDPFNQKAWSGSSYRVFTEIRERGALHRAFGAELAPASETLLRLRHFHPQRAIWRQHYYMSRAYREQLTRAVQRQIVPTDLAHDFLVIGAMFDVPRLVQPRARVFSYHDGNLAGSLRSPYSPRGLSTRMINQGLAFERAVYQATDRIFTMSEYLRQSFIDDCDIAPGRVVNIGAGINLDALPTPSPTKRYDSEAILFVGADFKRKGGPLLLEAFRRVREIRPRATLHVVGPASLDVPPHLMSGVVSHGFLNKFDVADRAKLDQLYASCALFVLPSLYEPFGIAPLEAMAHGIPAIVSRGWALQESVQPGITGAHVEVGSVDDLTDALQRLLADPAALQRMGKAAHVAVAERYTWGRVIDRMLGAIDAHAGDSRIPAPSPTQSA